MRIGREEGGRRRSRRGARRDVGYACVTEGSRGGDGIRTWLSAADFELRGRVRCSVPPSPNSDPSAAGSFPPAHLVHLSPPPYFTTITSAVPTLLFRR